MSKIKIAVIGLGYVGLPLAQIFATKYAVVGFDINKNRIKDLKAGIDNTKELNVDQLLSVLKSENSDGDGLFCTNVLDDIKDVNFYIITVPTPVNKDNTPDLSPLIAASKTVGSVLKKNDIVVYESTVYPGATEDDCVPILEQCSNLKFNLDFFVGYSPERINPGDKLHTVDKIVKVTAGSTAEIARVVNETYQSVITAGTHLAPSIKVAEAAKVIENAQRDINIAFVNELAIIFNLLDINTHDVLAAAGTKWNFLPFKPGLVGGHCIGVDPYYLAEKAKSMGYHPNIILSGRKINDSMSSYVASQVVKLMINKDIIVKGASLLLLGITFKENCPDIRNSKLIDLVNCFLEYGMEVIVYDPVAEIQESNLKSSLNIVKNMPQQKFDVVVLGVAHNEFLELDIDSFKKNVSVLYDIKGVLTQNVDGSL